MTKRLHAWRGLLLATLALQACLALRPQPALALDDPELSEAYAAIVCDQTGTVLWSQNGDAELPMASITKIMTAMVALDSGVSLDKVCTITEEELHWDSQTAGFTASDTPTLRELLQAMLVYSGNDAALNVALNVSGSEQAFVDLMNAKAAELGMTHTHFVNSHGLEAEGHYSSVEDLAIMGRYAMVHYPLIAQTVCLRSVDVVAGGEVQHLESTDDLMETYEGLLGIKTGAVAAGTTFLGASRRGTVALYTAVLGCDTSEGRFADTAALMDWAYDSYDHKAFGGEGWVVRVSPYALGFNARCTVTLPEDPTAVTWPVGQISYRKVSSAPDLLVEPGDAYSSTSWRQTGRFAGGSNVHVDGLLSTPPSVNVFALPLFAEGQGV